MINLTLSVELREVRDTVRRYVEEQLLPLEPELGDDDIPDDIRSRLEKKVKEMGFWSVTVPSDLGGGGIGQLGHIVILEQISRCLVGDIRDSRGFGGNPWPVLYHLGEDARAKYLKAVVEGEATDYFAMTEADAGNDGRAITTTAARRGDGWVLNGTKSFITGAHRASFGSVVAVTGKDSSGRSELSVFVVDSNSPGVTVSKPHRTMGAANVYDVTFHDCLVPTMNLIGAQGEGPKIIAETLRVTRLRQGAYSLGLAHRALSMAIEYAINRITFGAPLIERGAIQRMIVGSYADVETARLLLYATAAAADQARETDIQVRRAKTFAAEACSRVIDRCIQIHGGSGVVREQKLERIYRDQRSLRITEGSTEVHQWISSRQLLRHPPDPISNSLFEYRETGGSN